jgi:hypothetical protein
MIAEVLRVLKQHLEIFRAWNDACDQAGDEDLPEAVEDRFRAASTDITDIEVDLARMESIGSIYPGGSKAAAGLGSDRLIWEPRYGGVFLVEIMNRGSLRRACGVTVNRHPGVKPHPYDGRSGLHVGYASC